MTNIYPKDTMTTKEIKEYVPESRLSNYADYKVWLELEWVSKEKYDKLKKEIGEGFKCREKGQENYSRV